MAKHIFPLAIFERIYKSAGAERVSEDAKEELRKIIEKVARDIAADAVKFTKHYKRNTVMPQDIELALK